MNLISNDFGHKRKIYNFDPYNVLLAIVTNIPQRLKTAFVVQGHIYHTVQVVFGYFITQILHTVSLKPVS